MLADLDAGLSLDDIAATLTLPIALIDLPWLGEFYGKASCSARACVTGTLGRYDGNPTHLRTFGTKERAAQMAKLAGEVDELMRAAKQFDDLQWCLELRDHLTVLGAPAKLLKATSVEAIAETEINATTRNTNP